MTANGINVYETIGALINIKTISNAELLPFFALSFIVFAPLFYFSHISFSIHLERELYFFIYSFNVCV
jgi:hypothetical protein